MEFLGLAHVQLGRQRRVRRPALLAVRCLRPTVAGRRGAVAALIRVPAASAAPHAAARVGVPRVAVRRGRSTVYSEDRMRRNGTLQSTCLHLLRQAHSTAWKMTTATPHTLR